MSAESSGYQNVASRFSKKKTAQGGSLRMLTSDHQYVNVSDILSTLQHLHMVLMLLCFVFFSTKIIIKKSSSSQNKPLQQTRTNLETNHSSPRGDQQMAFSVPEGLIVSPMQKCTRLQCVAPTLCTCARSPGGQLKAPGGCRQLHRRATDRPMLFGR